MSLDAASRSLIRLSAGLATRSPDIIRRELLKARDGAPAGAVEETILQGHLFVGFPDTIEALRLWRDLHPQAPAPLDEDESTWAARGDRVCATVYGPKYPLLRHAIADLHPDFDRWMVVGGYGRVLGRPGLDLVTRELCVVALLAVWNAPRQLHAHLRGAVFAGATLEQVDQAVEIAGDFAAADLAAAARDLWRRLRGRYSSSMARAEAGGDA